MDLRHATGRYSRPHARCGRSVAVAADLRESHAIAVLPTNWRRARITASRGRRGETAMSASRCPGRASSDALRSLCNRRGARDSSARDATGSCAESATLARTRRRGRPGAVTWIAVVVMARRRRGRSVAQEGFARGPRGVALPRPPADARREIAGHHQRTRAARDAQRFSTASSRLHVTLAGWANIS